MVRAPKFMLKIQNRWRPSIHAAPHSRGLSLGTSSAVRLPRYDPKLDVSAGHPAIRARLLGGPTKSLGGGCVKPGEADTELDRKSVAAVVSVPERDGGREQDFGGVQPQQARLKVQGAAEAGAVGHREELFRIGPAAGAAQLGWESQPERRSIADPSLSLAASSDFRDRYVKGFQAEISPRAPTPGVVTSAIPATPNMRPLWQWDLVKASEISQKDACRG